MRKSCVALIPVLLGSASAPALARDPSPAPYSLPWQLRPAAVANVVRSDTALAFFRDPMTASGGATLATTLLVSHKLRPDLAPLVRVAVVRNAPPAGADATSFVNPVLGGTYVLKLRSELRLALFLGLTVPVGMGGGDSPDAATASASGAGILARSAMDNAMFAVNDLTVFPGVDLAYVARGLTVQLEATVLQLTRVRGSKVQPDSSRTNLTSGLHVGYFFLPALSAGIDFRYQRWLSTPTAVKADASGTLRDNLSFAVGIRGHFKLTPSTWLRPGLAYARGLDDPMSARGYDIVQLDLPLAF